jgi:hypothetical protein
MQGVKIQVYQVYTEVSQRSRAGWTGFQNVRLFLSEPLVEQALSDVIDSRNR